MRTPSVTTRAGTLSGGNIQKVLLARELSSDPKVVVFNKPTYGLDIRTTLAVRTRIQELAAGGVASLVISTDLDELLGLCDRIAVLYAGAARRDVRQRPGRGRADRRADGREQGGVSRTSPTAVEDAPENSRATAPLAGIADLLDPLDPARSCWRWSRAGS